MQLTIPVRAPSREERQKVPAHGLPNKLTSRALLRGKQSRHPEDCRDGEHEGGWKCFYRWGNGRGTENGQDDTGEHVPECA